MEQLYIDLTQVSDDLVEVQRKLEELRKALWWKLQPDVILVGIEFKSRIVWDGQRMTIRRHLEHRQCNVCGANFGCAHL